MIRALLVAALAPLPFTLSPSSVPSQPTMVVVGAGEASAPRISHYQSGIATTGNVASESKETQLARRFASDLERVAEGVDGVVSYLVVDLTTGERFARHADEPFPTASTIKIGILYELFAQADAGAVHLDTPSPLPPTSRAGGAGILQRLTSPSISLRDHALLMILLSDNTATNVLIDTLGREAINARMRALGASGYRLRRRMMDAEAAARGDENVASASDLVTVMEALRTGKGLRPQSREAAIGILREYGPTAIRAGVPPDVAVAAKPGALDGVRSEIAWVDLKGRPYLVCVMASFLADDGAGEKVITDISRAAHRYFARRARAGVEGRLLPP